MTKIHQLSAVATALLAVTPSFAASVTGLWHGIPDLSQAKAPKGVDAKSFDILKKTHASLRVELTLNANKTYSAIFSGGGAPKPTTLNGTWSQKGNKLTLKRAKRTNTLILSPDGKILTMLADNGLGGKLVFRR